MLVENPLSDYLGQKIFLSKVPDFLHVAFNLLTEQCLAVFFRQFAFRFREN